MTNDYVDPNDVAEALEHLSNHSVQGTPELWAIRTLEEAHISPPIRVGRRTVREWSVQHGDPQHGAHRSDDHISSYVVVVPRRCPECGNEYAVYDYSAHHNIAASEALYCDMCERVHESEEWT